MTQRVSSPHGAVPNAGPFLVVMLQVFHAGELKLVGHEWLWSMPCQLCAGRWLGLAEAT